MKTLVVFGNDKISHRAISAIALEGSKKYLIDCSTDLRRILQLLKKRRIALSVLIRMFVCELRREGIEPSAKGLYKKIHNNEELLKEINDYRPQKIVLFRAGLIISKKIINMNIPLMNIHCAKIPEYGGIGSIHKALQEKTYEQEATLHQVTTTIDEGLVYDTEPYVLNHTKSYCENEAIAYKAGVELLRRTVLPTGEGQG